MLTCSYSRPSVSELSDLKKQFPHYSEATLKAMAAEEEKKAREEAAARAERDRQRREAEERKGGRHDDTTAAVTANAKAVCLLNDLN